MTKKEIDKLEMAILKAEKEAQKYADTEDGGSCNFDTPMIKVKATEKQLAQMDWQVFKVGKRQSDRETWYQVLINLSGQGNRRTRMAEAAAKSLQEQGYESSVYYEID